jgi:hypothetical protein
MVSINCARKSAAATLRIAVVVASLGDTPVLAGICVLPCRQSIYKWTVYAMMASFVAPQRHRYTYRRSFHDS